jgi:hypothetical protein
VEIPSVDRKLVVKTMLCRRMVCLGGVSALFDLLAILCFLFEMEENHNDIVCRAFGWYARGELCISSKYAIKR